MASFRDYTSNNIDRNGNIDDYWDNNFDNNFDSRISSKNIFRAITDLIKYGRLKKKVLR